MGVDGAGDVGPEVTTVGVDGLGLGSPGGLPRPVASGAGRSLASEIT
jgi:hypothetical protein